ncbi:hypothetical protein RSSM_05017 [Rhodopirellula sallentina SM41]|uniref:Uncharacterized protein n=1 Tax=Rhodopirellula sallentina SM41 TaxID=1263870 RepID=M5U6Q9_9BACT|nr:hypothetical protein RSSM_05017 [Rhodopirellula sallentina SM41]
MGYPKAGGKASGIAGPDRNSTPKAAAPKTIYSPITKGTKRDKAPLKEP